MGKKSAGILLYRFLNNSLQVLLVHPGGPFWKKKDLGAWTIPKGEFIEGQEDALVAAKREFKEETGFEIDGNFMPLSLIKQKSGKVVYAWALKGDLDINNLKSNIIKIEWPPHSDKMLEIPEIDKAEWLGIERAKEKIISGQASLINELVKKLQYVDT
jgi:predicted NUDIX family NTP pyrophosphohydrolase